MVFVSPIPSNQMESGEEKKTREEGNVLELCLIIVTKQRLKAKKEEESERRRFNLEIIFQNDNLACDDFTESGARGRRKQQIQKYGNFIF